MEHTGTIWMASESEAEAKTGSVTVTDDSVRVAVNGVAIGTWPNIDATPTDEGPFRLDAGRNTLMFRPDDYVGFAAEVEALTFRSRIEPDEVAQPTALATAPPRSVQSSTGVKSAGVAAVLSALWSGLGQIYNGQIAKGIILMLVQSVNVLLMFVLVGFLTYPVVWIYGIWDAYTTAEKINSGEITV